MITHEFLRGYIGCALWASTDDDMEPLDKRFHKDDIAPADLARMKAEATTFLEAHEEDLDQYNRGEYPRPINQREGTAFSAGMDLWLTRNAHGSGFWEGHYPQDVGDRLTAAAKALGSEDLYIGDDGILYLFPPDMTKKEASS